jgi:phospholipase/carboxylesterase
MANFDPHDPHANQAVLQRGAPVEQARAAVIMVHGRGATAESILTLAPELQLPNDVAILAPQALGATWYPLTFLAPMENNEPFLSSALKKLESVVKGLIDASIPSERIAILGFSQGACLTLECVARNARTYGAIMALSGGLIGPPGTRRNYAGRLNTTPIFIGAVDPDPHIPIERARQSEQVLRIMGAKVELRRYPNMPHAVNSDEMEVSRELVRQMLK